MDDRFDFVTFDCYGTLIDWESGIVRAFQAEAARDSLDLRTGEIIDAYMIEEPAVEAQPYRSYREVLSETALRVASRLGWSIDSRRSNFLPDSLPSWLPFSDTNAALEALAARYRLGILSNIDDELLTETQKHFSVEFDLIVTAQQVRSYKPGHAHFREALARASGKELLHAAQSYFHDIVPCRAIGIPVIWVNRKRESLRPGEPRPDAEVSDLTQLTKLLVAD